MGWGHRNSSRVESALLGRYDRGVRMSVVTTFWIGFAATLCTATTSIVTGRLGQRRFHLASAVATLAALTVTVVYARRLTEARVLPRAELDFHLWFAKSAAWLVLPVVGSGVAMLVTGGRSNAVRIVHRTAVLTWLLVVLTATGTGIWMYSLSSPR